MAWNLVVYYDYRHFPFVQIYFGVDFSFRFSPSVSSSSFPTGEEEDSPASAFKSARAGIDSLILFGVGSSSSLWSILLENLLDK